MALLLLTGCDRPPTGQDDRAHYLSAINAVDGREGLDACVRIQAPRMRGDCLSQVGPAAARQGHFDAAMAACGQSTAKQWVDECRFAVVDTRELIGEAAWALCAKTGRYRPFCTGHAVTRRIAQMDDLPLEVGQEVALAETLQQRIDALNPPLPQLHRQRSIRTGMARHLSDRWADRPFDASLCGAAEPDLCRLAYTESMHGKVLDYPAICAGELTLERIEAMGGKPWTDGSETITLWAWAVLCKPLIHRGGPPPPMSK
ncbi:MAG: hypothetical protein AAFV53_35540 [Myxococcota bacterium]